MSDWVTFLHRLGRFASQAQVEEGLRPCIVLSLPCLDYVSVMLASGFIVQHFFGPDPVPPTLEFWAQSAGRAVCFPRVEGKINGDRELRLSEGIVDSIDVFRGVARLLVTWIENGSSKKCCAVPDELLPLVSLRDNGPDVTRRRPGSKLAQNVNALAPLLGESGLCNLLKATHNVVQIHDTKNRLLEEVQTRIPLARLATLGDCGDLLLRDLVRLDLECGQARHDTHCCKVSHEAGAEFPLAIFSGSLRFLRGWDDCSSPIRIATISPYEANYAEAVKFANDLFYNRKRTELIPPEELLQNKPPWIDIQFMNL